MLAFSAIILTLAIAVPQFAQLVGGPIAFRSSLVVATGASLSSFANVLEDGLKMEWAFFGFVLGKAIILLGLLALTIAVVARERQRRRRPRHAGNMAGGSRCRPRAHAQASAGRSHNVLAGREATR